LILFVNRWLGVHRSDHGDDAKNDGPKSPHACLAAVGSCQVVDRRKSFKNNKYAQIRSREIPCAAISDAALLSLGARLPWTKANENTCREWGN